MVTKKAYEKKNKNLTDPACCSAVPDPVSPRRGAIHQLNMGLKRLPGTLRELLYEGGVEVKAKLWLIMIILFLYVIVNCMGELLRWSVPLANL